MEAKELRIGNYVLDRGNKLILIDHWEYKDKISSRRENIFHPLTEFVDYLKPIPLTEEWLVKFGFLLDLHHHRGLTYSLNRITTYMQDGIFWCDILWDCLEIKHVHQLQNLYFALTNEELTIK